MTATAIAAALRASLFAPPAHVLLEQVRNGTGYGRQRERYADALAVSVYPSRGLWLAGVEIKVDRRDWLRELKDPDKAEEIARFCHYWWIAAPPDVVQVEELPVNWGLAVVKNGKAKAVKRPVERTPEPLTMRFVASVLRNVSGGYDSARAEGRSAGYADAEEKFGADAQEALKHENYRLKCERDVAKRDCDHAKEEMRRLRAGIEEFEVKAGIPGGALSYSGHSMGDAAEQWRLTGKLLKLQPATFRTLADELDALRAKAKE